MIVGTAGHIDHGKTTLIQALTGVDADRLPEEKKRGITLDLGFAFLDLDDGSRIGFIDAPGHERLVHTMVAGATGIDFALLLVAADDGIMPQTREHLAVLSLLDITRGAVIITKADRADTSRLETLRTHVSTLLQNSSLADAPILTVSAYTGDGIADVRSLLAREAQTVHADLHRRNAGFRLAIDRVFSLEGSGTTVTGTVHAGCVRPGDELTLMPGERKVRVRSVHAQNRAVEQAEPGQRCALVLAGATRHSIQRGHWVVTPLVANTTARLDARLRLWHDEEKPVRSGTKVHVHIGSSTVMGTIAILDSEYLQPGQEALVQLVLRTSIGAWWGDRIVLRDASGARTLAGGRVLDPGAPVRYRRTASRLAELKALSITDPDERLHALARVSPLGVDLHRFRASNGVLNVAVPSDKLHHQDNQTDWLLGQRQLQEACEHVLATLHDFHDRHPDQLGPDSARLRRLAMPRLNDALQQRIIQLLRSQQKISQRGAFVHLPEHSIQLSQEEQRIAEKIAPKLAEAHFNGAWVRDLAQECNESEGLMRTTLGRLARQGELHQVVKDLYYPLDTMQELARIAREHAQASDGKLTAAVYRTAIGLGRKRAIQILEYFDRVGLMRRVKDEHRLRADSTLFSDTDRTEPKNDAPPEGADEGTENH